MQTWGNLWAILLLVTIGSATFSAFGLIVASVTNTMQETQMINQPDLDGFPFSFRRHHSARHSSRRGSSASPSSCPPRISPRASKPPQRALTTLAEVVTDAAALAIGLVVAFEISRQLFRWEPEAKVPGRAKLWVLAAMVPFLVFGAWENVTGRRLSHIQQNFRTLSNRAMMEHMSGAGDASEPR